MSHHAPGAFAPLYYPDFHCIADRCRHSCCVDWEICIDDATMEKYRPLRSVMETVEDSEDGPCFALRADGRCPHLRDDGLCRLILDHGEDYLSDICRRHPRFYNDVGGGRVEVGLGLVCEEACRLILADDRPFALRPIDLPDALEALDDSDSLAYDPLPERDVMLSVIAAHPRYADAEAALRRAFDLPAPRPPAAWLDRLLSLEILDPAWEELLHAAKGAVAREPSPVHDAALARLLAYFVYRHVSVAVGRDDLRARLGFALLSVSLLRYLHAVGGEDTPAALADLARRYSAEIEYSEDNTDELIFAVGCGL